MISGVEDKNMELRTFRNKPSNNFNLTITRSGLILFNKSFRDQFNIRDGHRCDIVQDTDNPTSWYLKLCGDDLGFQIRRQSNSTYCISSTRIRDEMRACFSVFGNIYMAIADEPREINKRKYFQLTHRLKK